MGNALSMPAPPDIGDQANVGGNALGGAPASAPGQGASPTQGAAPPAPPPAPSHQQTVAALRHFDAVERELTPLLKNPDLGKTNMRAAIIDSMTSLVSNGIMTAPQAVNQLADLPNDPFQQKKWLMQHFATTANAQQSVLAHHQAAFAGQNVDETPPDPDDHVETIQGLKAHYPTRQRNA